MPKKVRFFFKRSSKVEVSGKKPVIIPFQFTTIVLLIVMILVALFLFLRSDLFQIKTIDLASTVPECATEEGVKLESEAVGVSIIFYDVQSASQKILSKFYCLESVVLTKDYPSTLKIRLSERKPVAAAVSVETELNLASATQSASFIPESAASASAFFALDKSGIIFKNLATTAAIPKVAIAQTLTKPGRVEIGEILWLLKFLDYAQTGEVGFSEFTKTKDAVIVGRTNEGFQIILSSKTDAEKIASSLQGILRQAKIEGVKFSILDLRFEKPVLR